VNLKSAKYASYVAVTADGELKRGHLMKHANITEITTYLTFFATAPKPMRRKAVINAQRILEAPGVEVIPQSRDSFLSGMALYAARPDKGYSLTDCISMATMRKKGLTEVLTNDRHFDQEGFRALFRDS
jgi:uncharacterized protein